MMMACNSILESNHASSMSALITGEMIRLDHAAGECQTRSNNDFGYGHDELIGIGKDAKEMILGTFY